MNKTSNYQLCQWDGTDRILRTDFNEDNAKIDAALKQQANSIASINSTLPGKADAATVTSLTNKLSTEIQERKDAVTAEAAARAQADNTEKAAREAAITAEAQARAAALALKGNCQIYFSSYVGDGELTKTLTFPGKPLLVNVQGDNLIGQGIYGNPNFMCRTSGTYGLACSATWNGNSLTWDIFQDASLGCNYSGFTYLVIALMAMDE